MKQHFSLSVIFAFLLGALLFGTHFVFGFIEPTQTPPLSNVPTPLNTGSTGQSKAGGLILNTGGAVNGLIVDKGNVGIGIVNPPSLLSVGALAGSGSLRDLVTLGATGTSNWHDNDEYRLIFGYLNTGWKLGGISISAPVGMRKLNFYVADFNQFSLPATPKMVINHDGNVGIGATNPSEKLEVAGNVKASAFFYSSDERLKTTIRPIGNALEKVRKLTGVYFKWKESGAEQIGLLAQDVEEVFPETVATDPKNGYKSVQYGNLIAPLIESVKELDQEVTTLQLQNLVLEKKIEEMEEILNKLKTR
jgi:hypothetical protein